MTNGIELTGSPLHGANVESSNAVSDEQPSSSRSLATRVADYFKAKKEDFFHTQENNEKREIHFAIGTEAGLSPEDARLYSKNPKLLQSRVDRLLANKDFSRMPTTGGFALGMTDVKALVPGGGTEKTPDDERGGSPPSIIYGP